MVVLMDNYNFAEGLFLKNYLGTVSAVQKAKRVAHVGTQSTHVYGKDNHLLENGMFNHARIGYELGVNKEDQSDYSKKLQDEFIQKNTSDHVGSTKVVQVENIGEKEKKKERKWTLGGFFRKKGKKDADDSSNNSDEDNKKGFLSRRKSKRDRRKFKFRTNTNGFDVVIVQHKESAQGKEEVSMEQLWSGNSKEIEGNLNSEPVRYINRHPEICKTNYALQVPKHCNRNSNISRTSGGNENAEGKRNRKEVMARAEAKRDMMRDDSSSEDCDSYHSSSSPNRYNSDCRRLRRIDRHKRLSKDEDIKSDLRKINSYFERDHRLLPNSRWISKADYENFSDLEASKLNLRNYSETPSPCRSPRTRHKPHQMKIQKSYPTSTFPPGIHCQGKSGALDLPCFNFNKENQPLLNCGNQGFTDNRNSECSIPKSMKSSDGRSRKTLMDYEQFMNSCGSAKMKSLSYDEIVHRAPCFENESELSKISQQVFFKKALRSNEMLRGSKEANIYNQSPPIFENPHNKVVENRNESAPSQQTGTFPQKPTQIIQRTASGNSFCENSRNVYFSRSNSCNHIPTVHRYCSREDMEPKTLKNNIHCNLRPGVEFISQKLHLNGSPSVIRYYADQNPRSRNPIHITCNPTFPEQPYLSDSQMVVKPAQSVRNSASNFWKLKDKELMKELKKSENFLKLPPTQSNLRLDRSRSNSPKFKTVAKPVSQSLGNEINKSEKKTVKSDIKKTLKEECDAAKVCNSPPEPPVRRLSKEEVLARLQKCEELKNQENELKKSLNIENKTYSTNLDEALIELELIYNSLRLKDDNLEDWAEIGNGAVFFPQNSINSTSVCDKIQNFFGEAVISKNVDSRIPEVQERDTLLPKSGISDKKADDMAFRRMNQKDRAEVKKLPTQSYLLSSPALSPSQQSCPIFRNETLILEPDITYDDVMFRNIRHANNRLKIQDPQPPFGIPIGVVPPAPDSDYLHATPTERFRPSFISSKTPDVVKDDLAFRNLRKDNKANTCIGFYKHELKKRAVRSLSANLYSVMQKDTLDFIPMETNNNNLIFDKNREKTQSLTDLTEGKHLLEKKLKKLKEEKRANRDEYFELPQEARKKKGIADLSWSNIANPKGNFEENLPIKFQKNILSVDDGYKFRSPVVELSKYPAAAPSFSLQGDPLKEYSFVDDNQLENLLSALAKEAENTSKDLKRQLDQLETKKVAVKSKNTHDAKELLKVRAVEEFNKKFKVPDKTKRKRNLSLSNTNESKEEVLKTNSLERRKKNPRSEFIFAEVLRNKINETKSMSRVMDINEIAKPDPGGFKTEGKLSKSDSTSSLGCRDQKQNQSFEVVSDLSEILHDVEVEPHVNPGVTLTDTNVFQEVYDYNCKLSSTETREGQNDEENLGAIKEVSQTPCMISDIEIAFEKLHQEFNSTKVTKGNELDDLIANITSVNQSPSDSYSSFPFPKDNEASSSSGTIKHKDGIWSRSSKGEGEAKKASFVNNVWLLCSYAIAFAFYLQEIDFLTALGVALAVISVLAILIL